MIGYILIALIVVLILLPPKYDPAVRLKEWVIEQRRKSK